MEYEIFMLCVKLCTLSQKGIPKNVIRVFCTACNFQLRTYKYAQKVIIIGHVSRVGVLKCLGKERAKVTDYTIGMHFSKLGNCMMPIGPLVYSSCSVELVWYGQWFSARHSPIIIIQLDHKSFLIVHEKAEVCNACV